MVSRLMGLMSGSAIHVGKQCVWSRNISLQSEDVRMILVTGMVDFAS